MSSPHSFRCTAQQNTATVPFVARWSFLWPTMSLDLEPDVFILRPLRPFQWLRSPIRIRYEAVAEASVRPSVLPGATTIHLRLTDAGQGRIWIVTPNEGALELAHRLEERGVALRRSRS